MDLQIIHFNRTIQLRGRLTISSIHLLEKEIYLHFNSFEKLTLNIDKVTEIDTAAVNTILNLYMQTKSKNKHIFFSGNGSRDLITELDYRIPA